MIRRLIAIAFIYACTAAAWLVLGASVFTRTHSQDSKLRAAVGQIWGTEQAQKAPSVACWHDEEVETRRQEGGKTITETRIEVVRDPVPLESTDAEVSLGLEHRKKGLLWYTTYTVDFSGAYAFANPAGESRTCTVSFDFPAANAIYDGFSFVLGARETETVDITSGTLTRNIELDPGETVPFRVAYRSQGLDRWWYDFGGEVNQVRNFRLRLQTDFDGIDYPQGSISPRGQTRKAGGWELSWEYENLLTGARIGVDLPDRINPGPWVGRVTLSAPISLFLFFFLMFLLTTLRAIRIHPMNYFFLGASFFSFHLLLAYLVDHVAIPAALILASAVSVGLVVSYMRLVTGTRFALVETALSQILYLVLFSCSFFLEGYTGLAITILCILTLFTVMQFTGRLDWEEVFRAGQTPAVRRMEPGGD